MCFPCCCWGKTKNERLLDFGDQAYKASPDARKEYSKAQKFLDQKWGCYKNNPKKTAECVKKYAEHLLKSAKMGLADAQREVGIQHIDGAEGFKKNRKEARKWLQLAVNQEDKLAKQYLDFIATLRPDQSLPGTITHGDVVVFCSS